MAGKVIMGLSENATIYSEPDPSVENLTTETTTLRNLLNSKDGSIQKNQAITDQSEVVFGLLKTEASYVDKVCNGDRAKILLSGFDTNKEMVTHDIPGKAVIKRVEDGVSACSAKVFAEKLDYADRYRLQTTTTPEDSESWQTVLDPASLRHLEIENLERGQEIFIRIIGGNTHGWGTPSAYVSFIPR